MAIDAPSHSHLPASVLVLFRATTVAFLPGVPRFLEAFRTGKFRVYQRETTGAFGRWSARDE